MRNCRSSSRGPGREPSTSTLLLSLALTDPSGMRVQRPSQLATHHRHVVGDPASPQTHEYQGNRSSRSLPAGHLLAGVQFPLGSLLLSHRQHPVVSSSIRPPTRRTLDRVRVVGAAARRGGDGSSSRCASPPAKCSGPGQGQAYGAAPLNPAAWLWGPAGERAPLSSACTRLSADPHLFTRAGRVPDQGLTAHLTGSFHIRERQNRWHTSCE